jgi:hypothetical protein
MSILLEPCFHTLPSNELTLWIPWFWNDEHLQADSFSGVFFHFSTADSEYYYIYINNKDWTQSQLSLAKYNFSSLYLINLISLYLVNYMPWF